MILVLINVSLPLYNVVPQGRALFSVLVIAMTPVATAVSDTEKALIQSKGIRECSYNSCRRDRLIHSVQWAQRLEHAMVSGINKNECVSFKIKKKKIKGELPGLGSHWST